MNIEEFKVYLSEVAKLISPDVVVTDLECDRRASKFLEAQYRIAVAVRFLDSELLKLRGIETAVYASLFSKYSEHKSATERKAFVEADEKYQSATSDCGNIEKELNFLKAIDKVFTNAHVFYRQKLNYSKASV